MTGGTQTFSGSGGGGGSAGGGLFTMMIGWGSRFPRNDGHVFDMTPEEREAQFERQWQLGGLLFLGAFGDLVTDEEANEAACEFVRKKIREIVKDPEVAEHLCPDTRIFCKRLCADTVYFEAFNRDNVHLIDVKAAPIEEVTADGPHIKVVLNGTTIVKEDISKVTDAEVIKSHPGLKREKGHIAFCGHGDRVEFRNLRIKLLD